MTVAARRAGHAEASEDAVVGSNAPGSRSDLGDDREFCRALLPRVSRTFAINIRLLSGSFEEAVRVAYLLCRASDTLEDAWPGDPASIRSRFARFLAAVHGDGVAADELAREAAHARRTELESVAGLPRILNVYATLEAADREAIAQTIEVMARGMCRYAARASERRRADGALVPYLDDQDELFDYCYVVAGCVGVMLTRMFDRRAPAERAIATRRLELAPRVGEALQLTNILLDWPSDLPRGRCHVPACWLAELGIEPGHLTDAGRPGVRELALRLDTLARDALERVPDYLDAIPRRALRYRLFCLWPALWARASLDRAWRDAAFPGGGVRPKLSRAQLWAIAFGSIPMAGSNDWARRRLTRR